MTETVQGESVPFWFQAEGQISVEQIPELIDFLGRISTEASVHYGVGSIENLDNNQEFNKQDFLNSWGRGAGIIWVRVFELASTNPEFPLKPGLAKDYEIPNLVGNAASANKWLEENKINGIGPNTLSLLKNLTE